MRRLVIVYNPRSSRYAEVEREVLGEADILGEYLVEKYEVKKIPLEENVARLAKILKDDDVVISAGGDATGVICANGILESGKDATLVALPYGNFNDLARTLGVETLKGAFSEKVRNSRLYPLEIIVDGEIFRYATCYATIGMMADSVKIYDAPSLRRKLKTRFGRAVISYTDLTKWYFKNRHRKVFLPQFYLNGRLQDAKVSDYVAVNGRYIARVLKGGEYYHSKKVFCRKVDGLTRFWRLVKFMIGGMVYHVRGDEATDDILEFMRPAKVEIQAEGEYRVFENVKKIEIKKSDKYLKVIEL